MNLGLKILLGITLSPFIILTALLAGYVMIHFFAQLAFELVLFFLLSTPLNISFEVSTQTIGWGIVVGLMVMVAIIFGFTINKSELQTNHTKPQPY